MSRQLLAIVRSDCPTCEALLPVLGAATAAGEPVRLVSQSGAAETAAVAERVGLAAPPELDDDLAVSARWDPATVPALLLLDDGEERDRVEGLDRARIAELAAAAGAHLVLDDLPAIRPGCASRTREPDVAPRLAADAARAAGRIRSRALRIGELEDWSEWLFERGMTDGLPVVPPTPERVLETLEHTARGAQEVVAVLPPYDGSATVEKVAINAVLAGCPPAALPLVLAALDAAADPAFALHGVLATTYPACITVVVSGPLAADVGMNGEGNCLGQGNRANLTIGRALALTVRNVGGGRPQREDRATHGQMGKLSSCFAERIEDSPWEPLSVARGLAPGDTGVTVLATEGPRVVVEQHAREPEALCRAFGPALHSIGMAERPRGYDALVVFGPDHARIFARAGWSRSQVAEALFQASADPEPKFADPARVTVVHAGGDAGLFSMVYGSWVAAERGSWPVTRSVAPWR
jgi:hypothetical protein